MLSDQLLLWTALPIFVLSVVTAARSSRYRLTSVNVAAASLAVLLFLGYDRLVYPVSDEFEPADFWQPHDILGSSARPNGTTRWTRQVGFTELFDITITTNADGFRVTPPAPDATRSIIFFGCSYSFGHGVEDHETYPYLVGEAVGGSFAAYNVSFNAWGPHEMLAALQSGLVERVAKEPPQVAVFLTLTDHVRRVIGREADPSRASAPRFVLENGVAVRRGTFEDDPLRERFSASDPGYWGSFAPEDFQLYGAVVKAARDEVLRRFPGTRFEVILWDTEVGNQARGPLLDALRAHAIYPRLSDEFLTDGSGDRLRYMISEDEIHPNPEGLRLLARFIETELVEGH